MDFPVFEPKYEKDADYMLIGYNIVDDMQLYLKRTNFRCSSDPNKNLRHAFDVPNKFNSPKNSDGTSRIFLQIDRTPHIYLSLVYKNKDIGDNEFDDFAKLISDNIKFRFKPYITGNTYVFAQARVFGKREIELYESTSDCNKRMELMSGEIEAALGELNVVLESFKYMLEKHNKEAKIS